VHPSHDEAEARRLVGQLESESFQEWEAATRALRALGEKALPALKKAAASSDPEVQRRAARLLRPLEAQVRMRAIEEIKQSKLMPAEKGRRLKEFISKGMTEKDVERILGNEEQQQEDLQRQQQQAEEEQRQLQEAQQRQQQAEAEQRQQEEQRRLNEQAAAAPASPVACSPVPPQPSPMPAPDFHPLTPEQLQAIQLQQMILQQRLMRWQAPNRLMYVPRPLFSPY
jgi:hypothetical protein